MLRARVIPCLQLVNESLVKSVRYQGFSYVGDPVNTVRIFNELEVDELVFIDIRASKEGRRPNIKILKEIADECFMPVAYGGGVTSLETASQIFALGFEKLIFNTACFNQPQLVESVAKAYGSQAVVAAIDVRRNLWGKYETYSLSGTVNQKKTPVAWVKEVEELGVCEILLTSIDREGTWKGLDEELVYQVANATTLPVIAHGGANSVENIKQAIKKASASAVALGSMVVYQGKDMGVLVNFPDIQKLEEVL